MWPYWLLFLIPAQAALASPLRARVNMRRGEMAPWNSGWIAMYLALCGFMGFRHHVGGDWGNYLDLLDHMDGAPFADAIVMIDPGYAFLCWLSLQAGSGIYPVNLACAALFSFGLIYFCLSLPRPWLAMTAAIPYLVIVVGMGYTRQGVALGCAMAGMVALRKESKLPFIAWIAVGILFHKSAVLVLPIAGLATSRNRYWSLLWIAAIAFAAYAAALRDSASDLVTNYIEAQYQSQGAFLRLAMNLGPAILILRDKRSKEVLGTAYPLWKTVSQISILLFLAYFLSPSSTAVDRIALYMIPVQLTAISILPDLFRGAAGPKRPWVIAPVLIYALVLAVWLNFAVNAFSWVPYGNAIFMEQ